MRVRVFCFYTFRVIPLDSCNLDANFVNHLNEKPQPCAAKVAKSLNIEDVKSSEEQTKKFIDIADMVYAFCRAAYSFICCAQTKTTTKTKRI